MADYSAPGGRNGDDEPTQGRYQLVCAVCEGVLEGRYETRAKADEAADDHVVREHEQRIPVVVLAVAISLLEEDPERALAFAMEAQRRLDLRGEDDEQRA